MTGWGFSLRIGGSKNIKGVIKIPQIHTATKDDRINPIIARCRRPGDALPGGEVLVGGFKEKDVLHQIGGWFDNEGAICWEGFIATYERIRSGRSGAPGRDGKILDMLIASLIKEGYFTDQPGKETCFAIHEKTKCYGSQPKNLLNLCLPSGSGLYVSRLKHALAIKKAYEESACVGDNKKVCIIPR